MEVVEDPVVALTRDYEALDTSVRALEDLYPWQWELEKQFKLAGSYFIFFLAMKDVLASSLVPLFGKFYAVLASSLVQILGTLFGCWTAFRQILELKRARQNLIPRKQLLGSDIAALKARCELIVVEDEQRFGNVEMLKELLEVMTRRVNVTLGPAFVAQFIQFLLIVIAFTSVLLAVHFSLSSPM